MRPVGRLSEVTLKNKKGTAVELSPTMPANTAESVSVMTPVFLSVTIVCRVQNGTVFRPTASDNIGIWTLVVGQFV